MCAGCARGWEVVDMSMATPGPNLMTARRHPFQRRLRWLGGALLFAVMLAALLLILGILAIILGIIFWNGLPGISWQFLTQPPSNGLEGGGIFPAIFGTLALVLIMT